VMRSCKPTWARSRIGVGASRVRSGSGGMPLQRLRRRWAAEAEVASGAELVVKIELTPYARCRGTIRRELNDMASRLDE
jgi:hypothetical protein